MENRSQGVDIRSIYRYSMILLRCSIPESSEESECSHVTAHTDCCCESKVIEYMLPGPKSHDIVRLDVAMYLLFVICQLIFHGL